jgi:alkaline phosphatase D
LPLQHVVSRRARRRLSCTGKEGAMPNRDMPSPARRRVLRMLGGSLAASAPGLALPTARGAQPAFLHGVASGDPQHDRVVIWTRVTPPDGGAVAVRWEVAHDRALRERAAAGESEAGPGSDYTVKIDVGGLRPGRRYFYRFAAGGAYSRVGTTRTLPAAGAGQVRFAVFSCSNYPSGFFNAYADAARLDDLDAVLHLGDYLYEYGTGEYDDPRLPASRRALDPPGPLLTLADYRRRHAHYRGDPDLQALHAGVPFITVWDDHEIVNDAWRGGAADHESRRHGPFEPRKAAAVRAYHEWMPIRAPDPGDPGKIYRSFDFGGLAALHMLDTRLAGRDRQLHLSSYLDEGGELDLEKLRRELDAPWRRLLGAGQLAWLDGQLARSRAPWQLLGQQVLMAPMEVPAPVAAGDVSYEDYHASQALPDAAPRLPSYLDTWDGYPAERNRLYALFRKHDKNVVVLSGDSHNAWASDLRDDAGRPVGVEFAAPSATSPGLESMHPELDEDAIADLMRSLIGSFHYLQPSKRGYLLVTVTADEVHAEWRLLDTVLRRGSRCETGRVLRVLPGAANRRIVEAGRA